MRDHFQWRPNWHYSEYHQLQHVDREERRHAIAAFLGALSAVLCFAGIVYMLSH